MPLTLTTEEQQLKDTAQKFFTNNASVANLRQLRDSSDALGYSSDLWKKMAELGWASIILPQEYSGLDFSFLGLGSLFEESGRTLTSSPLFSTLVLGASTLMLGGNAKQKQLLTDIGNGSLTLSLALEESNHHNPTEINLQAIKKNDQYHLHGKKTFVLDGHSANKVIVVARTACNNAITTKATHNHNNNGISLFLVDRTTPGIHCTRTIMVDSRNYATLHFDDVCIDSSAIIGETNYAWDILEPVLDRGRICLSAEMLGSSLECFDRTITYLKEREQFGVKIGSFQALKHRAAQMFVELELCKSVVMAALSALDEKQERQYIALLASLCKSRLNDTFRLISNEAIQMHGGIGITDELDIGLFLKRSRVCTQILGDSGYHQDRYASLSGY